MKNRLKLHAYKPIRCNTCIASCMDIYMSGGHSCSWLLLCSRQGNSGERPVPAPSSSGTACQCTCQASPTQPTLLGGMAWSVHTETPRQPESGVSMSASLRYLTPSSRWHPCKLTKKSTVRILTSLPAWHLLPRPSGLGWRLLISIDLQCSHDERSDRSPDIMEAMNRHLQGTPSKLTP